MSRRAWIAASCVAVCAAAAAAWVFFGAPGAPRIFFPSGAGSEPAPGFAAASSTEASTGPLKPPRTPPAGQKELYNEQYRFALFYPDALSMKAYDEGGGASTIALQNVARAEGLQIFIVPYKEAQVSGARFRRDVPSGVMREPLDVSIDGATATSFYSTNAMLGDTAEIWFIHGGYLFEVTAPKSEAAWLSEIMQTWQFI